MTALLIIATYLVGAVLGYRAGYVAGYESGRRNYQILGAKTWHSEGLMIGTFAGLLWPVAWPVLLVGKYLTPVPPSVKEERREQLIAEQAREIARLEREAGIR